MWTFYEKNKQAIHDIVLLLAAVLGCCLFFRYLFRIFLPFLIGWLLSLLFNPLADRLQKFHIPRGISAIIGILLLFALLGLLIIILFYRSAKQNKDHAFAWMWLSIVLSFGFYIPVVLWADSIPLIGMLMIPKTCAYVWAVLMGYFDMRRHNRKVTSL